MKKRVADIIMEILIENNITDCFSVVGGGAMHLNNAFALCDKINKVFNHHEQASAMAAEAYARACGKLAVVCVTSGPGGINTLNGVEGAWVDNIPMLVISGQVRIETSIEYTGLDLRCRGVQEFDIVSTVNKMTKYAKKIMDPLEVKREINKAIRIAMTRRRGPVWIDIPLDIQSTLIEVEDMYDDFDEIEQVKEATDNEIKDLLDMLGKAKRPCILTGSGIRSSNAIDEFRKCIKKLEIPIVGGALQADILYTGCPLYYGLSGIIGPRTGNFILQNADVILVLGNSLSYNQTGFNQQEFAPNAKIIMVDIDENEYKKMKFDNGKFICSDLKKLFVKLDKVTEKIIGKEEWIKYCENLKKRFLPYEALKEVKENERISSHYFWKKLNEQISDDAAIALGNSSCSCVKLQEGVQHEKQRVIVNCNSGSMGYDLPGTVGAAIALKKEIICVTGDGSIMMNLQELQTIIQYKLPIKIVMFSNDGYGAIRQTCKNFFDGKYIGCDKESGVSFPNFENVIKAFDIPYKCCNKNGELEDSISWLLDNTGYAFLEIKQKMNESTEPKVMSRMNEDKTFSTPALQDMYPFLDKKEMEELMISK